MQTYLTQVGGTEWDKWRTTRAANQRDAAYYAVRREWPNVQLPVLVYVDDLPTMHHDNGTPMVVRSFRIERT